MIGGAMRREVGAELEVEITAPTTLGVPDRGRTASQYRGVTNLCPSSWTAAACSRWRSAVCTATAFTSWTFQSAI